MSQFQWWVLFATSLATLILNIVAAWQRHVQVRYTRRKEKAWKKKNMG